MKASRGDKFGEIVGGPDEEEEVIEIGGIKLVEVLKETWTGRSVRSRGFPKTSSPLSRIAKEKDDNHKWEMRTQIGLNFLSHGNGNKIEFLILKI